MEHDLDREEFETIPWSQLAPPRMPMLTRVMVVAAGVLGVAVIGVFGARLLRDGPPGVTVTLPPDGVATASPEPVLADPAPVVAEPPPSASAVEEQLYSEADLMAVMPEEDQRAAATRAEWFVTDFFTVDGDAATSDAVRAALPDDFDAVLPHDAGGGVSYVEWARAMRVAPDGPGRYLVTVAFRVLSRGSGDSSLMRAPVQAVHVRVAVDGESSTAVVDLPEPAVVEAAAITALVPPDAEPPPEVVAAALELAALLGTDAAVEQAGVDETGWRIVVSATSSGLRWPYVVRPGG